MSDESSLSQSRKGLPSLRQLATKAFHLLSKCYTTASTSETPAPTIPKRRGPNGYVPVWPILRRGQPGIPARRNVKEWFEEAQKAENITALELSLFITAVAEFQSLEPHDQLSYFRIAGIHGLPSNVSWNMVREPIPRDAPDREEWIEMGEGGSYSPHNRVIFPTWNRLYLELFERTVNELMKGVAEKKGKNKGEEEAWVQAALNWRLPYWDWALNPSLPQLVSEKEVRIVESWNAATGRPEKMKSVRNPMYSFKMPGDMSMGDAAYGDYRIDNDGYMGPWDTCKETRRHWLDHRTQLETMQDAVHRLLNPAYSPSFEDFASTRYHKDEHCPRPESYLSLESISNNLHALIGGIGSLTGLGHMSSVSVAAFDPVFWLHYCNVDRLLYLWQNLNDTKWFAKQDETDDGAEMHLRPFRYCSYKYKGFFDSDMVRNLSHLAYTYDDIAVIFKDANGPQLGFVGVDDARYVAPSSALAERINTLYSPSSASNFLSIAKNGEGKHIDPIINIVYNRYALGGLQYAIHFFFEPIEPNIPFCEQKSLVASMYTFSSPFSAADGSTRWNNCKKQAESGVLSCAQIPLQRVAHLSELQSEDEVRGFFKDRLRWVAVLDTGLKVPWTALPDLEISLLLGKSTQPARPTDWATFESYEPVDGMDWNKAEL